MVHSHTRQYKIYIIPRLYDFPPTTAANPLSLFLFFFFFQLDYKNARTRKFVIITMCRWCTPIVYESRDYRNLLIVRPIVSYCTITMTPRLRQIAKKIIIIHCGYRCWNSTRNRARLNEDNISIIFFIYYYYYY